MQTDKGPVRGLSQADGVGVAFHTPWLIALWRRRLSTPMRCSSEILLCCWLAGASGLQLIAPVVARPAALSYAARAGVPRARSQHPHVHARAGARSLSVVVATRFAFSLPSAIDSAMHFTMFDVESAPECIKIEKK